MNVLPELAKSHPGIWVSFRVVEETIFTNIDKIAPLVCRLSFQGWTKLLGNLKKEILNNIFILREYFVSETDPYKF